MEASNARNESKIRNLSIHLTRLTRKDISAIRRQVKREAEAKTKRNSKANAGKKKSLSRQSHETTSSVICVSESAGDASLQENHRQKPTKTRSKRKSTFSSSRSSKKKKSASNITTSRSSLKKVILNASTSTWDDHRSYSTSEESEFEEVFVPRKIWVKPSARSMSPTCSKFDVAPESENTGIPREMGRDTASKFCLRKPVVLLKKVTPDTDVKDEICDETASSSNSNCHLQWQKVLSQSSTQAVTTFSGLDDGESESEESADENLLQQIHQCSCQLKVTPPKKITSAVQTDKPEAPSERTLLTIGLADASTQSTRLIDDPAETCTQNTVSLRDASSPVIFDEASQATQELSCHDSSPIIFGSNEGTVAESENAPDGSNNQCQNVMSNPSNTSSNFSLELSANEKSVKAIPSKNGDLKPAASQNFNLQLSQNLPDQNAQSNGNSQVSRSSCNFTLEIPGECTRDSADKNSPLVSSKSIIDAPSNLCRPEASNIPDSDDDDQLLNDLNFSGSQKVLSPVLKSKSHSKRIGSSAVEPPNFFENQKIFLYSVKPLNPKRQKTAFSKKRRNLSGGEKSKSSVVKDPSLSKRLYPLGQPKSHVSPMDGTKSPTSLPVKCNDAFTQTDLQGTHQQPSQLSVNYIINSSSLDTIRFEGPVMNHPSTLTAIGEKVPASSSNCSLVADGLHCTQVFSPDRSKGIPCKCNVRNLYRCTDFLESDNQLEKPSAPAHSTSTFTDSYGETPDCRETAKQPGSVDKPSQIVIDSIDLTGDDEPTCEELLLGKVSLKTPSKLGCTIAFADDVERLFRHELPKVQCDFDKLELLKNKHFDLFQVVLVKFFQKKIPVIDALHELFNSRSVPCGYNLLRQAPPAGLSSVKMTVKSLAPGFSGS